MSQTRGPFLFQRRLGLSDGLACLAEKIQPQRGGDDQHQRGRGTVKEAQTNILRWAAA